MDDNLGHQRDMWIDHRSRISNAATLRNAGKKNKNKKKEKKSPLCVWKNGKQ